MIDGGCVMISGLHRVTAAGVVTALTVASLAAIAVSIGTASAQQPPPKPAAAPSAPKPGSDAQQRAWCNNSDSSDVQTIIGCSALIKSGREKKHDLVIDYNNRGVALYNKKDYDHAILDYNAALKLDPNYAPAYNGRCAAFNAKGNAALAIADCDQAIQIDPKFAYAYNNRSIAKRAKGDAAGAEADIAKARALDPNLAK